MKTTTKTPNLTGFFFSEYITGNRSYCANLIRAYLYLKGERTIRQMSDELGINEATVTAAVYKLAREGALEKDEGPKSKGRPYRLSIASRTHIDQLA